MDHNLHSGGDHDNWYAVHITWSQSQGVFTWQNRAGVTWTLTPMMGSNGMWDISRLSVGNSCPYRNDGHEYAMVEWVSYCAILNTNTCPYITSTFPLEGSMEGSMVVTTIWGPWSEPYLRDMQGSSFTFDSNSDPAAAIANRRRKT